MKIIFRPYTKEKQELLKPISAVSLLPEWYKEMHPYIGGKKAEYYSDQTKNITIKRCNPVGDALGAGYLLLLENDIYIKPTESGEPEIIWHRGGQSFISTHGKDQIDNRLIPEGFSNQPFKFTNNWSIQTPSGYSVLVTHPLNRYTDPFITLSGVVDTDTYQNAVQLPFLIRKDFEGIIEAGTPIAQIIPFRRDNWKSEFAQYSKEFYDQLTANFWRVLHRYYKRFHWKRKEYK